MRRMATHDATWSSRTKEKCSSEKRTAPVSGYMLQLDVSREDAPALHDPEEQQRHHRDYEGELDDALAALSAPSVDSLRKIPCSHRPPRKGGRYRARQDGHAVRERLLGCLDDGSRHAAGQDRCLKRLPAHAGPADNKAH